MHGDCNSFYLLFRLSATSYENIPQRGRTRRWWLSRKCCNLQQEATCIVNKKKWGLRTEQREKLQFTYFYFFLSVCQFISFYSIIKSTTPPASLIFLLFVVTNKSVTTMSQGSVSTRNTYVTPIINIIVLSEYLSLRKYTEPLTPPYKYKRVYKLSKKYTSARHEVRLGKLHSASLVFFELHFSLRGVWHDEKRSSYTNPVLTWVCVLKTTQVSFVADTSLLSPVQGIKTDDCALGLFLQMTFFLFLHLPTFSFIALSQGSKKKEWEKEGRFHKW